MDPITFYGRRKKSNLRARPINGYESDDSVLASDSDEERYIQNMHCNIIIPEGDRDDKHNDETTSEPQLLQDDDDDDGNAATVTTLLPPLHDDDDDAIPGPSSNVSNFHTKNIHWRKVNNRTTQPITPRKGSLQKGPENPNEPIDYFRKFIDLACLANIKNQTNLYAIQSDPSKPINITETG
jgi:hypothetical protein